MFSKILVKLVDQAIAPALLLFSIRVISLFVFASYFDVNFVVSARGISFNDSTGYILVNSYSLASMVMVLVIVLLYNLFKAYYFHNTHITPSLTAKLFTMRLSGFIQSSMDVYSQGVVWLSFTYLMVLVSGLMAFFGLAFAWVFFVSFIFAIITTVMFILDIEKELIYSNKLSNQRETTVLKLHE